MDEYEDIYPQGGPQGALAQAIAPATSTTVPSAPLAAVPAAKPDPSEYEKATAAYQQQRMQLIEQQKKLIESLEARVGGPSEMLFALAQGFSAPSRTGSFGESLGYATQALGAQQAKSQQAMSDIAKMRMELAAQQVGMAKEDVELAKKDQAFRLIGNALGSSPQQASELIGGVLDKDQAKKLIQIYPQVARFDKDAAAALKNSFDMTAELRKQAQEDIKNGMQYTELLMKYPPQIRSYFPENVVRQFQSSQGVPQVTGPQQTQDNVIRQTRPTEAEALQTFQRLNAAGLPATISVAPNQIQPSASVQGQPQRVVGQPISTSSVVGAPEDKYAGLSPVEAEKQRAADLQAQREIETEEKKSGAKPRAEAVESLRKSFLIADDVIGMTNEADSIAVSSPAIFQMLLNKPIGKTGSTIGNFIQKQIQTAKALADKGIITPWGSFSIPARILDEADLSPAERMALQQFARVEATFTLINRTIWLKGQGAVSNMEGQVAALLGPQTSDLPEVVRMKAEAVREKARFEKEVFSKWNKFDDQGKGNFDKFLTSDDYISTREKYNSRLKLMNKANFEYLKSIGRT